MNRRNQRGNSHADDSFVMACPDCERPLMLSTDDLSMGQEIECSHCQHTLYLTTTSMPGRGGRYWTLVSHQENPNER
ncbi:hypothetical protein [Natronospira bacteriovora]|uniref:Uncharacterized protein n=1 Tax=Natronospira bacteriovora TaxID=3069753 RepID=A0ABU0W4V8_9GAMM|nr:hypothetical protein [Natronospira sp. AB-CW4]MDQ2069052.1 hypothetical protein [Natronospira sp. AB-CW4]